jgi:hypothetical protein
MTRITLSLPRIEPPGTVNHEPVPGSKYCTSKSMRP